MPCDAARAKRPCDMRGACGALGAAAALEELTAMAASGTGQLLLLIQSGCGVIFMCYTSTISMLMAPIYIDYLLHFLHLLLLY